jgi:hypothetical protein
MWRDKEKQKHREKWRAGQEVVNKRIELREDMVPEERHADGEGDGTGKQLDWE